jgi:tryptophan-rich sensory protein
MLASGITPPSRVVAAAVAASAFAVPLAMSASSSPAPPHLRVLAWYKTLRMPAFKPPDWVIPAAWAAIETGLATSAYRLLRTAPSEERTRALGWLAWNVTMIGGWSRLFFKHRRLGASTLAAASMVATGAALVRQSRPLDPVASRAAIPFVAWVSFATVLTAAIWRLNARRRPFH